MPSRSFWRLEERSRDTCIWLTPTAAAISDWVRPSTKRIRRIDCSRSGRVARAGPRRDEVDATRGVETIDRLHERYRRHLHQVVQRLTSMEEATCELVSEPE